MPLLWYIKENIKNIIDPFVSFVPLWFDCFRYVFLVESLLLLSQDWYSVILITPYYS